MPLRRVNSVALSQVVSHPERLRLRSATVAETLADHHLGHHAPGRPGAGDLRRPQLRRRSRLPGTIAGDDLTVRISAAADGAAKVAKLVTFATALQLAGGSFG